MQRPSKRTIVYTIVVPTYHEVDNIKPLTIRIFNALKEAKLDSETELIIVDDNSNDGTEANVKQLQDEGYNVRIIVRRDEVGLSSAVLRGFNEARGRYLLCLDADLQHPPESVPEFLNALSNSNNNNNVEFVIGTRYGGKHLSVDKNWPLYRRVISTGARLLARPLSGLSDPMSGFFGLDVNAYKRASKVSPVGFKIALELYVKCNIKQHKEIPIAFGVRTAGESKLTSKVMVYYLQHLFQLYLFVYPVLFPLFLLFFFLFFLLFLYFGFHFLSELSVLW